MSRRGERPRPFSLNRSLNCGLFRRSAEPVGIVGCAWPVFYSKGWRRLREYVVHEGNQAVTLERLRQKWECSPLDPMTGKFLIRIPRHQNNPEAAPDQACANRQFMTIDVRELVGGQGELKTWWR